MTDFAMYVRWGEGRVRLAEMDADVRRRCRIAREALHRLFDEGYREAEAFEDAMVVMDIPHDEIFRALRDIVDREEQATRTIIARLDVTYRQFEEYLYCCVQMEDAFQGDNSAALWVLHRFAATAWWR